jgi:hypothetical protein
MATRMPSYHHASWPLEGDEVGRRVGGNHRGDVVKFKLSPSKLCTHPINAGAWGVSLDSESESDALLP